MNTAFNLVICVFAASAQGQLLGRPQRQCLVAGLHRLGQQVECGRGPLEGKPVRVAREERWTMSSQLSEVEQ